MTIPNTNVVPYISSPEYKPPPPPEYRPKKALKTSISPELIFGVLR